MTNPTPDYSFKIKFNSGHQPFEKINSVENNPIQDALLHPTTAMGMDLKVTMKSAEQTKKATKRKLSFKVNDKNEIEEQVYSYPFPADVPDSDVWWMDDELDKLLTEAMLVADYYTRKRKDWQNKIKKIMKCVAAACQKNPGETVKGSDLDFVVDSDARGLELYIHPIFQKNREKAIKGVVKVQEEYNASEKKKGKVDPELRVKVLRGQSLKLTQLARSMAKTMADGDTRAARKEEDDVTGTDAPVPTVVKTGCGQEKSEELVNSEELQANSEELVVSMPRPRAKSIMRSFSPKRTQVST